MLVQFICRWTLELSPLWGYCEQQWTFVKGRVCAVCVCVNESTCLQFLCVKSRPRITGSYSSSALSYMKTQYGFSLAVLHFPVVLGIGLACQAASLPEPHLIPLFLLRQVLNFLS